MSGEILVLSGVRTAIGGYGGSLKDTPPSEMAAVCVREAVTRSGVDVKDVGHIVFVKDFSKRRSFRSRLRSSGTKCPF